MSPRAAFLLLTLGGGCLTWTPPGGDPGTDDDTATDDDSTASDDDTVPDDDTTGDEPTPSPVPLDADVVAAVFKVGTADDNHVWALVLAGEDRLRPYADEAVMEDLLGAGLPLIDDVAGATRIVEQGADRCPGPYRTWSEAPTLWLGDEGRPYDLASPGWSIENDATFSPRLAAGEIWRVGLPEEDGLAGEHAGPDLPGDLAPEGPRVVGPFAFVPDGGNARVTLSAPLPEEMDGFIALGEGPAGSISAVWAMEGGGLDLSLDGGPFQVGAAGEVTGWFTRSRRTNEDVGGRSLLLSAHTIQPITLRRSASNSRVWIGKDGLVESTGTAVFQLHRKDGPPLAQAPASLLIGGVPATAEFVDSDTLQVRLDSGALGDGWHPIQASPSGDVGAIALRSVAPGCDLAEDEPANDSMFSAQEITVGQVVCGVLDEPGDLEIIHFPATTGVTYRFEVWSNRMGTGLDPVIRLLDTSGFEHQTADDTFGRDPRMDWSAPYAGTWFVQLQSYYADQGDPSYAWRLVTTVVPADNP